VAQEEANQAKVELAGAKLDKKELILTTKKRVTAASTVTGVSEVVFLDTKVDPFESAVALAMGVSKDEVTVTKVWPSGGRRLQQGQGSLHVEFAATLPDAQADDANALAALEDKVKELGDSPPQVEGLTVAVDSSSVYKIDTPENTMTDNQFLSDIADKDDDIATKQNELDNKETALAAATATQAATTDSDDDVDPAAVWAPRMMHLFGLLMLVAHMMF
jgi:hypothetical protein